MSRILVSRKAAEAFKDYYDAFDDNENPEVIKYEIVSVGELCKVSKYYWSVADRRRIYLGFAEVPAKFDDGIAFK